MRLTTADLECPDCRSYVHPFLELCPACGARRTSQYAAALGDRPGDPGLAEDGDLARAAVEAATKYSLLARRGGALGGGLGGPTAVRTSSDPEGPSLPELADQVASALTYRTVGLLPDRSATMDADLRVRADGLQFRDSRRRVVLVADPALVVAATPVPKGAAELTRWAGIATLEGSVYLARPAVDGDGVLLTFRHEGEYRQVSAGNRRGLLASKARSSHYDDLVRWLGTLAATEAQARWRSIGAEAYAVELGLRTASGAAPAPAAPVR